METLTKLPLSSLIRSGRKAYLIGIGGVGMSAIARVLHSLGLRVRGSDSRENYTVKKLRAEGIEVLIGHSPEHLLPDEWMIHSSAISKDNPEFKRAEELQLPVYHRADVLSYLMNHAISLAITGTHGKTTCSALAGFLMAKAGLDPTCLVGGEIKNVGSNVILGKKHLFVAEVDESDKSQLLYTPDFALLTNLEADHLDVYQDFEQLKQSFRTFVDQVKTSGRVVYCYTDPHLREIIEASEHKEALSYGLSPDADYCASNIILEGWKSQYHLMEKGENRGLVELSIPGLHNVVNSLGVIALLRSFGLPFNSFLPFTKEFLGTGRRLEIKLEQPDLIVVDDYAHHPTEVQASLRALRGLRQKTTAVFQPHRFSRTFHLAEEFSKAFDDADRVILTDIYSAGEENVNNVDSSLILELLKKHGHSNVQIVEKSKMVDYLIEHRGDHETIAFLGAGDIGEIANDFANRFKTIGNITK